MFSAINFTAEIIKSIAAMSGKWRGIGADRREERERARFNARSSRDDINGDSR